MNTSLTLYQLSYQEIWWVEPRNFKVYILFTKFNYLYLEVLMIKYSRAILYTMECHILNDKIFIEWLRWHE